MEKNYVFKSYREGTNKEGRAYRVLELHDPMTLDNTLFYPVIGQQLPNLQTLKHKDQVVVVHGVSTYNGKPQLTIEAITKKAF